MESTQQLQPLDFLDTSLIMLDYDCETPALQLPDLDELHDSSQLQTGDWVTWPRYEFQKGLGHGPERAWVRVPKGPESRS